MRRCGVTTMVAVTAVGAMLAACGDATREILTDDAADRCARLSTLSIPATAITDAVFVDAHDAVPEHCRVQGQVETPGDGNVDSNQVGFQVGLPTEWNGDFYFQGLGAFAGHLGSLDTGLSRGYASATTDTGHRGSAELQAKPEYDGSWALNNRPRQIDYAYRGTHVATVAAKAVAGAYYGNEPRYSIFSGCSNGGRQGLMEAQRYPNDYDGIIANSPAISVIDMLIAWIWQAQAQLATPDAWLSPRDLAALSEATIRVGDPADGLTDGIIADPRAVAADVHTLGLADALTPAQLATAQAIYAGPGSEHSDLAIAGHPIGHEEGWASFMTGSAPPVVGHDGIPRFPSGQGAPPAYTFVNEFLRYFFFSDPTYDVRRFDLVHDRHVLEGLRAELDATDPDFTAYARGGGKLLITHGWANPALNAAAAVQYYDEVAEATRVHPIDGYLRLFMVPGMFHCGGGPGPHTFDALSTMESWLHQGLAPDWMTASGESGERLLCPYPDVAVHDGTNSVSVASSFTCSPT
jgi:hypothetical protein